MIKLCDILLRLLLVIVNLTTVGGWNGMTNLLPAILSRSVDVKSYEEALK